MDRVSAYRIVLKVLEKYRQRDFDKLVAEIGRTRSEECRDSNGALSIVDVNISWTNGHRDRLTVTGRIDNSNTFALSSMEEKIIVRNSEAV